MLHEYTFVMCKSKFINNLLTYLAINAVSKRTGLEEPEDVRTKSRVEVWYELVLAKSQDET